MAFKPFDPGEEVLRYRNHLPHWQQDGVTYFVTFRLHDSIPQTKLRQWREQRDLWMAAHGLAVHAGFQEIPEEKRPEYHRRFTKTFHDWLDAGSGACWLGNPQAAAVVADLLRHFAGERYELGPWVVMPNHVHTLVSPLQQHGLADTLHSWKGYTAHELNRLLNRKGNVWQQESYDHIVRSEEQLAHYHRYIHENPIKVKLHPGEYLLGEK